MNNFKNIFLNRVYILYSLTIIMMLSTVAILSPFTTELNILILAWGGIYFLYDLFTKRQCIKSKYKIFLFIYMFIFVLGIIVNRNNNLVDNVKTFIYTGLFLFVLYSYDPNSKKEQITKELYNINNIVIIISFVTGLIAFIMFILLIEFNLNGTSQGFVQSGVPALWGVYANPNSGGMVAVLSLLMSLFNLYLYKDINNKHITFKKIFFVLNIIIQWIYVVLCNSRGALLSLIVSILFLLFYMIYNKLLKKYKLIKALTISLIFTIFSFFLISFSSSLTKTTLSYIPEFVQSLNKPSDNLDSTSNNSTEINLDRDIESGHVSTGRMEIWSYGLSTLKENPLVGHGPGNIGLMKQLEFPNETSKYITTNNMHNGYIQILLSNGILGLISFLLFMIFIIKDCLITLFSKNNNINTNNKIFISLIICTILAIAINGVFENVILLTQSYITTILWTYIGYLVLSIEKSES